MYTHVLASVSILSHHKELTPPTVNCIPWPTSYAFVYITFPRSTHSLHYSRDTISFQVEAYDGGFPEPFTDIANVTVFLRGENDEAPSIIFPEGFQIFVPEN